MKEISIEISLTNEALITDDNFHRIRCQVKSHLESYVYHIIRETQGFLFFNKLQGGLNGYHESVRDLVIDAKLKCNCKIFLVE